MSGELNQFPAEDIPLMMANIRAETKQPRGDKPGLPGSHRSHIPTGHTLCLCVTAVCCSVASLSLLPDLSAPSLSSWETRFLCARGSQEPPGLFYSSGSPPWKFTSSPREESSFLWLFTLETPRHPHLQAPAIGMLPTEEEITPLLAQSPRRRVLPGSGIHMGRWS